MLKQFSFLCRFILNVCQWFGTEWMFKVHFSLFFPLTCITKESLSQLLTKMSHGDRSVNYESDYLILVDESALVLRKTFKRCLEKMLNGNISEDCLCLREKMGDFLISMQKWSQNVRSSRSDEIILNWRVFFWRVLSCPVSPVGHLWQMKLIQGMQRSGMQTQVTEMLDLLGTGTRNMWVMGF